MMAPLTGGLSLPDPTSGADPAGSGLPNKSYCMSAIAQQEISGEPQSDGTRSKSRLLLLELRNLALFAAAYLAAYGCARFFSERTGTRLWLPDSVLLCTLLLVPRKKWWLYVLMTMPIRFVPAVRRLLTGSYG
jgi:hypothetical protein